MTAGPVNRVLLESNFQNDGEIYSDEKTEACFDVVADQIDENWNYTSNLVANGTLSPYPSFLSRQAIINGNFDIWQRGTSFTNPVANAFTADRYAVSNTVDGGTLPTTINHTRQSVTDIYNSFFIYRKDFNGSGSGFGANALYGISQKIENGVRYLCGDGKKVSISFMARSNIPGKRIGVYGLQRYGTGGSFSATEFLTGTNFTLSSTFTRYTVTLTTNTITGKTFGTNNDDVLQIVFADMWGTATNSLVGSSTTENFGGTGFVDIAQVQLNAGDTPLLFQPRSLAQEEFLCRRYAIRLGGATNGAANTLYGTGQSYVSTNAIVFIPFTNKMRITPPTLTTSGSFGILLPGAGAVQPATLITMDSSSGRGDGVRLNITVATGLNVGGAVLLVSNNDTNAFLNFDAEL